MLVATFAGRPRYRMLDTLRAYGLDRLRRRRTSSTRDRAAAALGRTARRLDRKGGDDRRRAVGRSLLAEVGQPPGRVAHRASTGNLDVRGRHW